MNSKILRRILYIVLVAAIGFTGYFAGVLSERTGTGAGSFVTEALKLKKLSDIIDEEYYFQEAIDKEEAFNRAMASYVNQLGDPFSGYIAGADLNSFTEEVEGNYVGIGVEIAVDEDNFITVINSFDGSAAQNAGIKTGDRIIKVAGEVVTGDQMDETVDKIRGLPGETVELEILTPEGELKPLTLTRSEVAIETVRVKMLTNSIGYVRISSFDLGTDKEFMEKMQFFDFAKLQGLVIDLRSNSGGVLDSTVAIADYLMPEGTIVSVKYRNEDEFIKTSDAEHSVSVPICVLINEGTASAAELLSGALRDVNHATLIGKNSYGKGVVGQTFPVDSKSAVLLTVGEYFLPCGDNIHKIGLKPDIEVELENQNTSIYLMPETEDAQLQRAIEELKK